MIDDSLSDLEETKKMERTIERFMAQWEIKGASLAIRKNGKLLYSKGFGIADSAEGTPVNVSNIFRIASLSKDVYKRQPLPRSGVDRVVISNYI